VEFTDEFVGPGLERAYRDLCGLAAGDHLFAMQVVAFEFFRSGVTVFHHEHYLGIGRHLHRGGLETVVLDDQRNFRRICPGGTPRQQHRKHRQSHEFAHRSSPVVSALTIMIIV
jgi:hypothetical protein